MKVLKEQIKTKNFEKVYLFCGTENYLKTYYEKQLKKAILTDSIELMNLDIFEGKFVEIEDIINALNTLPFMCEKRLVIIKNSNLFETGRKDDTEKIKNYLSNIPEYTCILFIEDEVDKRNKLYKTVQTKGHIVEFKSPSENELTLWIQKYVKSHKKTIDTKTAIYMLRTVSIDMEMLESEMKKLVSYTSNNDINSKDIDTICSKSLETKIFDMLDAIGNKNTEAALKIYNNMLVYKESPIKILTMIIRQFRLLIQTHFLNSNGYNIDAISKRLEQRSFVIRGLLNQCKNFSSELLMNALEDCLETDISIKTGTISGETGIELLIIKYSLK